MKFFILYFFLHGKFSFEIEIISYFFFRRIWNVDGCVARKIAILWAFFMYMGQATKDILRIPRPSSPPAIQLEKR
jgi:hypothetical protein